MASRRPRARPSLALLGATLCLALAAAAAGCKRADAGRLSSSVEGSSDSADGDPTADRGLGDGAGAGDGDDARPTPECAADVEEFAVEVCNGIDDDCDGSVDERAAQRCDVPFALAACLPSGVCGIAECQPDYLDCNDLPDDGCETPSALAPCGCGKDCPTTDSDDDPPTVMAPMRDAGVVHTPEVEDKPDAGPPEPCEGQEPNDNPESCNEADDDCDGEVDEGEVCDFQMCFDRTPSYRGAECDACVCNFCRTEARDCMHNEDEKSAELCDDLVSCFVSEPCDDCYQLGRGPCAAQVRLASGGVDENDASMVAAQCAATAASACAAGTRYRDCINLNCPTQCADE